MLPMKADVPLKDQVMMFMGPFEEGLRANHPVFRDSPDAAVFLIVLKGVERSGTHSTEEIQEAFGIELPEG